MGASSEDIDNRATTKLTAANHLALNLGLESIQFTQHSVPAFKLLKQKDSMVVGVIAPETSATYQLSDFQLIECGGSRSSSRSVSWNQTGAYLAGTTSQDKSARIWTLDSGSCREVLVVSGHTQLLSKVRFHRKHPSLLATAAHDQTVRIWDVRQATQKSLGSIKVKSGSSPFCVEWSPSDEHTLVVSEKDGSVLVYDSRKLSTGRGASGSSKPLSSRSFGPGAAEACVFSPCGEYLLAGVAGNRANNLGYLQVWEWKKGGSDTVEFPAHVGPIYAMGLDDQNTRLATGGSDASVGLWDMKTLSCNRSITRRTKFIRGVAFSGALLAISNEEDTIDISEAATGDLVGLIKFRGREDGNSRSSGWTGAGAEEIAFQPSQHGRVLACARIDSPMGPPPSPITVVKLSIANL